MWNTHSRKMARMRKSCPAKVRDYHDFREVYSLYRWQQYRDRLTGHDKARYGNFLDRRSSSPLIAACNYGFTSPQGACCFYLIR